MHACVLPRVLRPRKLNLELVVTQTRASHVSILEQSGRPNLAVPVFPVNAWKSRRGGNHRSRFYREIVAVVLRRCQVDCKHESLAR